MKNPVAKPMLASMALLFLIACVVHAQEDTAWKNDIPVPVFDQEPGYVELYWKAWELARSQMKVDPRLPQSPYMDEALWGDTIWIWDTCFMVLFCKYAPHDFPGVESLNNFYVPLHDNTYPAGSYPLNIQHPDNPPLFAWVEYENFVVANNREHVVKLLTQTQYLQKHFEWFDTVAPGWCLKSASKRSSSAPTFIKKTENGYYWFGFQSGMDNTPRNPHGLWIDAISQQALSSLYISRLAERTGYDEMARDWKAKYEKLKAKINDLYWCEEDGIYYDIDPKTLKPLKVKTPASFWPMLAEVSTPEQAKKMVEHAKDPDMFGGERPWPSLARTSPYFVKKDGNYWRGGIWLPMAYMGTKALENYGYYKEADEAAERLLAQMLRTYRNYEPSTIWECYSPSRDVPANCGGRLSRPDFCGWSALGPISMFIENILGFHVIDAPARRIEWRLYRSTRHGIKNLRFGDIVTDIIYNGKDEVAVTSTAPYTLVINGLPHAIPKGTSTIKITTERSPSGDVLKVAPEELRSTEQSTFEMP